MATFFNHDVLAITHRQCRRDANGVVHAGYWWSSTEWEPLCELKLITSSRKTDEPPDTIITCVYCWYLVFNPSAKATGEL